MIIARRPSAAALADRVAFLVAGRIADIGPEYEALFNIRSAYVHDRRMNAISTDEMRRLNFEIDGKKRDQREVVKEWIGSRGL